MLNLTFLAAVAPLLLISVRPPTAAPASGGGLSVVTLNLAKEPNAARIAREFAAAPALRGADVVLLQEVKQQPGRASAAEQLAAALGLHAKFSPAPNGADDQGLAILSRYPLRDFRVRRLPAYDLGFHSRARFAVEATADAPRGPVRILNTHLDTRLNVRDRLAQLAPVLTDCAEFSGPAIVGGDFNSNGFYWLGHVLPLPAWRSQAADVFQALTRTGLRSAVPPGAATFDYLGMHLDWIWLSGGQSREYRIYPLAFSDHHALWTRIEF